MIGSTLPVATTDFTIVPTSTVTVWRGRRWALRRSTSRSRRRRRRSPPSRQWRRKTFPGAGSHKGWLRIPPGGSQASALRYRAMWILHSSEAEPGHPDVQASPRRHQTVGRAPRADFIVDRALVSRLHCRLEAGDDGRRSDRPLQLTAPTSTGSGSSAPGLRPAPAPRRAGRADGRSRVLGWAIRKGLVRRSWPIVVAGPCPGRRGRRRRTRTARANEAMSVA